MKILWLTNFPPAQVMKALGRGNKEIHGWNTTLIDWLVQKEDIELTIMFPQHDQRESLRGAANNGNDERSLGYIGYYENPIPETTYNAKTESFFREELERIKPDIVHIWGTEYVHTLCM